MVRTSLGGRSMKQLLLGSAVLMLTALGCNTSPSNKTQDQKANPAPANAPTAVSTVPVTSRKLHTIVNLPAQLIPYESVDVYPKVTGFVQTVTVHPGSHEHLPPLLVRPTPPDPNRH